MRLQAAIKTNGCGPPMPVGDSVVSPGLSAFHSNRLAHKAVYSPKIEKNGMNSPMTLGGWQGRPTDRSLRASPHSLGEVTGHADSGRGLVR